jgi:WD40 repeat protein
VFSKNAAINIIVLGLTFAIVSCSLLPTDQVPNSSTDPIASPTILLTNSPEPTPTTEERLPVTVVGDPAYISTDYSEERGFIAISTINGIEIYDTSLNITQTIGTDSLSGLEFAPEEVDNFLLASRNGNVVTFWSDEGETVSTIELPGTSSNYYFLINTYMVSYSISDVWIWDLRTFYQLGNHNFGSNHITSMNVSEDGLVVVGTREGIIHIWDIHSGDLQTIEAHDEQVNGIVFNMDESLVATYSDDNTIKIWDPIERSLLQILTDHGNDIWRVIFHDDLDYMASMSKDATVRLWDTESWVVEEIFSHPTGGGGSYYIDEFTFTEDGRYILTVDRDGVIKKWSIVTGGELAESRTVADDYIAIYSLFATPKDEDTFLLMNVEGWVRSYQVADIGTEHFQPINEVVYGFNPQNFWVADDHNWALIFGGQPIGAVWDIESEQRTMDLEFDYGGTVVQVMEAPDNNMILGVFGDPIQIMSPTNFRVLETFHNDLSDDDYYLYTNLDLSSDGSYMAASSRDDFIVIYDFETGSAIREIRNSPENVWEIEFVPGSSTLLIGTENGIVEVWDISTGQNVGRLYVNENENSISEIRCSADGSEAVILSWRSTEALVIDIESGSTLTTLNHSTQIYSLDYSPVDSLIVTGDPNGNVQFWDSNTGELIEEFEAHTGYFIVSFSKDGNQVYTLGYSDGLLKIWDIPAIDG